MPKLANTEHAQARGIITQHFFVSPLIP